MATWPATLPLPLSSGYAISPGDQTIRTEMEVGAPRVRRRTVNRNDKLTVSWSLTDAQLYTLREWFDDDTTGLAGGSAWFTVDIAVGGATLLESKEARFTGPFKADRDSQYWRVSGQLEVR